LVVLVFRADWARIVVGAAVTDTFEATVTTEVLATTEGFGGTEVLTTFAEPVTGAALVIAEEPTKLVKSEADERSTGILLKRTETNHPRY
jgi:hypothetical protein